MKKLVPVILALALLSLACGMTPKATPSPIPPNPTQTVPPTFTAIPPTNTPAPTVAPTATLAPVLPTAVPPTQAPAVPTPAQPEVSQNIFFEDDFSTPSGYWSLDNSDVVTRSLRSGTLQVHVISDMMDTWTTVDMAFSEPVQIDLDVTNAFSPLDGQYGAICGLKDNENFYGAGVGNDGYAEIFSYTNNERLVLAEDYDVTFALTGTNTNHITLTCDGNWISLEVNGYWVLSADTNAHISGKVGVLAGSLSQGDVIMQFDNMVVGEPYYTESDVSSGGEVLFVDDFSDRQSGWDQSATDLNYISDYSEGEYRIVVNQLDWTIWSMPYHLMVTNDVVIDVNFRFASGGPDSFAAVVCGIDTATYDNFHVLGVRRNGEAIVYKYKDGQPVSIFSGMANALHEGINTLTAICLDDNLTLILNNELVTTVYDPDLRIGHVGLLAGTYSSMGTDVRFDNFTVSTAQ